MNTIIMVRTIKGYSMNKQLYFDKLRRVISSCKTSGQFKCALQYVKLVERTTGDNLMTTQYLYFALNCNDKLMFKSLPPIRVQFRNGRKIAKHYNLNPDFLFKLLWINQ